MFTIPKRRALVRPDASYYFWRYAANSLRTWRAARHVPMFSNTASIASELEDEGIVCADCSKFLTDEGRRHLAIVSGQMLEKSRSPEVGEVLSASRPSEEPGINSELSNIVYLFSKSEAQSPDNSLIRLALDAKLLEIVAAYLGLWPRLRGVSAILHFPTEDAARASQIWHRDGEDLKLIKVFIYLVDVDENCGPFTYIPKTHPFGAYAGRNPAHKDRKRVMDEEMNRVFPQETHYLCTGPANTMVLADTVGFHRGGKPRHGNRIILTFNYTSAWAKKGQLKIAGKPTWPMNDMQRMAL